MSATIDVGKMRFSLFGRGYEDTRKDSGEGEIIQIVEPPIKGTSAIIDETKQYVWAVNGANVQPVFKYDITDLEDWQDEGQTIITAKGGHLDHPQNVDNNYGVHFSYPDTSTWEVTITVFDLTDDTVYYTFTESDNQFVGSFYGNNCDCILVDDKIYVASYALNFFLVCIDLTLGTLTFTRFDNEYFYGFINDELMLTSNNPVWFSDTLAQYGEKFDGTKVWTVYGVEPHTAYHTYVSKSAICANNFMYFPTFRGGHWRIAKYKGWTAPTFDPIPHYSADFGKFEGNVNEGSDIRDKAYDDERKGCAFLYGYSLYYTEDYKDLMQLAKAEVYSDALYPMALKGDLIITRDVFNKIVAFIL